MSSLSSFDIADSLHTFLTKIRGNLPQEYSVSNLYKSTGKCVIINTFNYMFYKIGEGIFVNIKDNEISSFVPFLNEDFTNEWSSQLQFPGIQNPRFSDDNILKMNADDYFIIPRYVVSNQDKLQKYQKYRLFVENMCAKCSNILNFSFFINVRMSPILTYDGTEPYKNIWGDEKKLVSHNYTCYTPIFSNFTNSKYVDIPIPEVETYAYNLQNFEEWNKKLNMAYYDGSLSSIGPSIETNLQLALHKLGVQNDKKYIDVNLYKDSDQIRKIKDMYEVFEGISNVPELRSDIPNLYSRYKYLIHIEGDPKSTTFFQKMLTGAIVIVIDNGLYSWFSFFTEPGVHYIRIQDISIIQDIVLNEKNPNSILTMAQILANCQKQVFSYSSNTCEHLHEVFTNKYFIHNFGIGDSQYSLQIMREKNFILSYDMRLSEIILARNIDKDKFLQNEDLKFYFSGLPRSYGKLRAIQILLSILPLARDKLVDVDIVVNPMKNDHHIFTQIALTNDLIRWTPNFIYLYKVENSGDMNTFQILEEKIFSSHTLQTYITQTQIGWDIPKDEEFYIQYLMILIQACLTIQIAQSKFLFMHNFLIPQNIRISEKSVKESLFYDLGFNKIELKNTQFCIYITKFENSHYILDNIDHVSFNNQNYYYNASYDLLNLIFSSLQSYHLQFKIEPDKKFANFTKKFIEEIYNIKNITYEQTLKYLYNTNYEKFPTLDPIKIFKIILKIEPSLSSNISKTNYTYPDNSIFRVYNSFMSISNSYKNTLEYFSGIQIDKVPDAILTIYNFISYIDILHKLKISIPSKFTAERKSYENYFHFANDIFNKYLNSLRISKLNDSIRANLKNFPPPDTNTFNNISSLSIPAETTLPTVENFNWLDYRWKILRILSLSAQTKKSISQPNQDFLSKITAAFPVIKNKYIFIQEAQKNRLNLNFHKPSNFSYEIQLPDI